ncbi:MAG TPA: Imm52 family immunity protein [Stellaceae bacterium]
MSPEYEILAYWGPRPENSLAIAPRILRMHEGLAEIDPLFATWSWISRRKLIPMTSLTIETVAERLEKEGRNLSDVEHEPIVDFGYSFRTYNDHRGPCQIHVAGTAGAYTGSATYDNLVTVAFPPLEPANAALINFRVFRATLLVLAQTWNATWAYARPYALSAHLPSFEKRATPCFHGGWITYLAAPFAAKIAPPHSAICEQVNRGLLMTATQETFRVDNPAHVAVARDIDAALSPINALPWPPDASAVARSPKGRSL